MLLTLAICIMFRIDITDQATERIVQRQDSDSLILDYKRKLRTAKNGGESAPINEVLEKFQYLQGKARESDWLIDYYIAYIMMYQTYFQYGQDAERERTVDSAVETLEERLADMKKKSADPYILLAALYNNLIDIHKEDTETLLDLVSIRDGYMKKAWRLDKKNPRYFLVKGQSLYYTPTEFGGGLLVAKKEFEKGLTLFPDEQVETINPDWGRSDLLSWLGYIAEEQEDLSLAISYYEKLLTYEPEYKYVRDNILPKLKAKHAKSKTQD